MRNPLEFFPKEARDEIEKLKREGINLTNLNTMHLAEIEGLHLTILLSLCVYPGKKGLLEALPQVSTRVKTLRDRIENAETN
jgi:hypothetical protein